MKVHKKDEFLRNNLLRNLAGYFSGEPKKDDRRNDLKKNENHLLKHKFKVIFQAFVKDYGQAKSKQQSREHKKSGASKQQINR